MAVYSLSKFVNSSLKLNNSSIEINSLCGDFMKNILLSFCLLFLTTMNSKAAYEEYMNIASINLGDEQLVD
jgi:hypothetical protein